MRIFNTKEPAARRESPAAAPEEAADAAQETGQEAQAQREAQPHKQPEAGNSASFTGTLANHKGKLAVGAAAMLGLAVFYKWRESKLARDDPEEYARLRRLKAAVDTDEA